VIDFKAGDLYVVAFPIVVFYAAGTGVMIAGTGAGSVADEHKESIIVRRDTLAVSLGYSSYEKQVMFCPNLYKQLRVPRFFIRELGEVVFFSTDNTFRRA